MARCSSVRTTTTRYRTLDGPAERTCEACRDPLPADAQFCPACGVCMLDPIELDDDDVEEVDEIEIEI
jgi:Zn finger protein HypA/HybF involved in hydrogenase expression